MAYIRKIAIGILIASVTVLTFISVLSIWDVLQKDVLVKSLTTIGVIAFAALIVVIASKGLENKTSSQ